MENSLIEQTWSTEGKTIVERIVKTWSDRYHSIVKFRERNYTDFT